MQFFIGEMQKKLGRVEIYTRLYWLVYGSDQGVSRAAASAGQQDNTPPHTNAHQRTPTHTNTAAGQQQDSSRTPRQPAPTPRHQHTDNQHKSANNRRNPHKRTTTGARHKLRYYTKVRRTARTTQGNHIEEAAPYKHTKGQRCHTFSA
jgi:hypothetical protein